MENKIGVIASDEELKNSIVDLFRDEVENGNIIIDILDQSNIDKQGKMLEEKGAKAIIARSGGYRHTLGKVNVPVIHLKISTIDILYAIKTAGRFKKDIVLMISDLEYFDYDEWKDMITTKVSIEKFHDADSIEEFVINYVENKDKVVIVGGGIPCKYAKKWGIDSVSIGATKESIYEGIEYAKNLADGLQEQKYKNEILETVLDGVHDAVISVDKYGK